MRKLIFLLITIVLYACDSHDQLKNIHSEWENKNSECLRLPIDTFKIISTLNLVDSLSFVDSISVDSQVGLSNRLDTLDLVYSGVMCDFPDWTLLNEYNKRMNSNPDFNIMKYSFYLEPFNDKVKIDDKYIVAGNIIRFIGKEYNMKGYPKGISFVEPNPPKGRVFRYFAYKIYRPYEIWGPNIIDDDVDLNGDTLVYALRLTIK